MLKAGTLRFRFADLFRGCDIYVALLYPPPGFALLCRATHGLVFFKHTIARIHVTCWVRGSTYPIPSSVVSGVAGACCPIDDTVGARSLIARRIRGSTHLGSSSVISSSARARRSGNHTIFACGLIACRVRSPTGPIASAGVTRVTCTRCTRNPAVETCSLYTHSSVQIISRVAGRTVVAHSSQGHGHAACTG